MLVQVHLLVMFLMFFHVFHVMFFLTMATIIMKAKDLAKHVNPILRNHSICYLPTYISAWYFESRGLNLGIFAMHCVNVVCIERRVCFNQ
jgi:hypothetical protein